MKKLIALLLAAAMLLGMTAMAESSMTTEELRALAALCVDKMDSFVGLAEVSTMLEELPDADLLRLYGMCVSETARRNADAEDVWYQSEDGSVTILVTGMTMSSLNKVELQLDYQILNSSAEKVSFRVDNLAINGWVVNGAGSRSVNGGTNMKNTLQLSFLSSYVGWETPKQAAEEIEVAQFDLVVTIGTEKITIPMVITDFTGLKIENR